MLFSPLNRITNLIVCERAFAGSLCILQDLTKVDLHPILPPATVMVVTVTASTTTGQPLTPEEMAIVEDACDLGFELDAAKRKVGIHETPCAADNDS
jgi:hypothetical protein